MVLIMVVIFWHALDILVSDDNWAHDFQLYCINNKTDQYVPISVD